MKHILLAFVLLLPLSAAPLSAQQHQNHAPAVDTVAVLAAAETFRAAIIAGDSAALQRIVWPDALILEGGDRETRAEYLSHHFGADGAFLRSMTREPLTRTVRVDGHTAWIASTSRMHGTSGDREVDLNSAELLVLRHAPGEGWRVAAVHWSSGSRN